MSKEIFGKMDRFSQKVIKFGWQITDDSPNSSLMIFSRYAVLIILIFIYTSVHHPAVNIHTSVCLQEDDVLIHEKIIKIV